MKIDVVKIGNSKGIRLPKAILDEYEIKDSVELKLKDGYIELVPDGQPRKNWSIEFCGINEDENEELLIPDIFEDEVI